jgi:hypothetical protein
MFGCFPGCKCTSNVSASPTPQPIQSGDALVAALGIIWCAPYHNYITLCALIFCSTVLRVIGQPTITDCSCYELLLPPLPPHPTRGMKHSHSNSIPQCHIRPVAMGWEFEEMHAALVQDFDVHVTSHKPGEYLQMLCLAQALKKMICGRKQWAGGLRNIGPPLSFHGCSATDTRRGANNSGFMASPMTKGCDGGGCIPDSLGGTARVRFQHHIIETHLMAFAAQ